MATDLAAKEQKKNHSRRGNPSKRPPQANYTVEEVLEILHMSISTLQRRDKTIFADYKIKDLGLVYYPKDFINRVAADPWFVEALWDEYHRKQAEAAHKLTTAERRERLMKAHKEPESEHKDTPEARQLRIEQFRKERGL